MQSTQRVWVLVILMVIWTGIVIAKAFIPAIDSATITNTISMIIGGLGVYHVTDGGGTDVISETVTHAIGPVSVTNTTTKPKDTIEAGRSLPLFLALLCLVTLLFAGCATGEYERYAQAQESIATANASARIAEANAIALIAQSGSEASKVAAVMTLRESAGKQDHQAQMKEPESWLKQAFQWAGLLVPSLVQGYSSHQSYLLGSQQSKDGVQNTASTNNTFLGIAGKIQAPAANISTTTSTTTDSHNSANVTNSNNPVDNHTQNNPITTTNPITGK